MSFWQELKRRNVFRVGAIYLAVAWLIVQVASAVNEPLNLPPWFETVIILLLAGGFPVALLLAWALELTPGGIERDGGLKPEADDRPLRKPVAPIGRMVDFAIIGVLVVALALTFFNRTPQAQDNSIAVLRFTNQSENPDEIYLSRSIPSEIHSRLVTVDGLFMVGENSSFQFDVETSDYQTIGTTLNAAYVLEGNFLKVGERIRVRTQLVRTVDGVSVWSNVYADEDDDIFSILPDIAISVADALSVELGVREREMRYFGTDSKDAFDLFIRGRDAWETDGEEAVAELMAAIDIDPNFAEAWAWLSTVQGSRMGLARSQAEADQRFEEMKRSAETAVALGQESWLTHNTLAWALLGESDWLGADEARQRAVNLARAAGARMGFRSATYIEVFGNMEEGARRLQAELEIDPYNGQIAGFFTSAQLVMGNYEEVRAAFQELGIPFLPDRWNFPWFMDQGDVEGVRSFLARAQEGTIEHRLAPVVGSRIDTLDVIRAWHAEDSYRTRSDLITAAHWAGYYDDTDLAVELLRGAFLVKNWGNYFRIWHDVLSETRQTQKFKEFMIDLGMADYWFETGDWGDYCRPLPDGDDFECE